MILSGCTIGLMYHISGEFDVFLSKEIKKRGIPINGKHSNLFMILHYAGEIEFKEIAKIWNKSKSTLCDIIGKYAKEGLVEKIGSCEDKRDVRVRLTEKGSAYAIDLNEIGVEFFEKATESLENEEKEVLHNILRKMKKGLH